MKQLTLVDGPKTLSNVMRIIIIPSRAWRSVHVFVGEVDAGSGRSLRWPGCSGEPSIFVKWWETACQEETETDINSCTGIRAEAGFTESVWVCGRKVPSS